MSAQSEGEEPATHNLGRQAVRGAVVTLAGQGAQFLMQMASIIILARLLTPRDYGLVGMILIIVGVGELVRDFGLSSAAIQARSLSQAQRDNLFWINTATGVLLCGILIAAAPLVAAGFGSPELTNVARVLSVVFVLNGASTQHRADLSRRLLFGRLTLSSVLGMVASLMVGVSAALAGAGYWSLVAAQLAQATIYLLALGWCAHWWPGRYRRDAPMGDLIRFGRDLLGSRLLAYASNNADNLTIALRFGAVPLGLYTRGFQLVMVPLNQFRVPITSVALPVLSRVQDDPKRTVDYLRRGQLAMGYSIVAVLAVVASCSVPLVAILMGPRWAAVAPMLTLLATGAAMSLLAFVGYWLYVSRGLTGALFRYTLATSILKIVAIVVGSQWGVLGVAAGFALANSIEWPISLWRLSRLTTLPMRTLYAGATRIVLLSATAGVVAFASWRLLPPERSDLLALVVGMVAFVAVYALAALLLRRVRTDIREVIATVRQAARRPPAQ